MNILIVKLSAIGDVIHALPVAYVLKKRYPNAHITWVVEPTAYELVKHNPYVDEIIIFHKKAFKSWNGFKENYRPFAKLLQKRKYDISIDLQGLFKSAAVVFAAKAKKKIGYVDMREGSNLISKRIVGNNKNGHIVDRYLDTVKCLDCDTENIIFPLVNTQDEIDFVDNLLIKENILNQKFIIFAVGTNWINKCWSVENFAKLSDLLTEYNLKVVLIGFGKDDEQKSQAIIKLARENNISVSKDEIEEIFNEHRKTSNAEVSESAFNKIIEDNYKLSPSEYRRMFIELPLLKQKVSAKIDTKAEKTKNEIYDQLLDNGGDFDKIAQKYGSNIEVSSPGFVKSTNIDGGRTKVTLTLEKDQISKPFISKSGDGYYIVKKITNTDIYIKCTSCMHKD